MIFVSEVSFESSKSVFKSTSVGTQNLISPAK